MKINELKVGDRVKYKNYYNNNQIEEGIYLYQDHCDPNYVYIRSDNKIDYRAFKEFIISKLELLYKNSSPDGYKEIPIEKEEKSIPKSFKFDVEFVNRLEFNQNPIEPRRFPEAYFRIDGARILNYPSKELESLNGKIVTIEIKEKD